MCGQNINLMLVVRNDMVITSGKKKKLSRMLKLTRNKKVIKRELTVKPN